MLYIDLDGTVLDVTKRHRHRLVDATGDDRWLEAAESDVRLALLQTAFKAKNDRVGRTGARNHGSGTRRSAEERVIEIVAGKIEEVPVVVGGERGGGARHRRLVVLLGGLGHRARSAPLSGRNDGCR